MHMGILIVLLMFASCTTEATSRSEQVRVVPPKTKCPPRIAEPAGMPAKPRVVDLLALQQREHASRLAERERGDACAAALGEMLQRRP